jgi:excisionase family DNA binding protein
MNTEYLSRVEVCLLLGVSDDTLTRMIRRGDLPPASHQRGSKRYWKLQTIRAALTGMVRPIGPARGENRRAALPAHCEARA